MFFLWGEGKKTPVYTYTSHGPQSRDVYLYAMKNELRLDTTQQTYNLLKCPMDRKEYRDFLTERKIIQNS